MNSCVKQRLLIWMPNAAGSTCRKVEEKLRRRALQATILLCRIAVLRILVRYFSNKWTPSFYFAEEQPVFCVVEINPTILHCWALSNPNTLLRYTLSFYIAEQFPISIHCWALPYPSTYFRARADLNVLRSTSDKCGGQPVRIK